VSCRSLLLFDRSILMACCALLMLYRSLFDDAYGSIERDVRRDSFKCACDVTRSYVPEI